MAGLSGTLIREVTERVFTVFSGGAITSGVTLMQMQTPTDSYGWYVGVPTGQTFTVTDGEPGEYVYRVTAAVQLAPVFVVGAGVTLP